MWNVKTKVIRATTGATGSPKTIQNIPEQHIRNARNQGTTENSHTWALALSLSLSLTHTHTHTYTLRKVLMYKHKTFNLGNNISSYML
jgi:hypothetical protein